MNHMAQVRVRKRGKTFSYIFEAGKKSDGKRKVVEKGGYPTKSAAYKAGVEAFNDFLHGNIGITSEAITLKDFMVAWLDNVVALNVKPTSLVIYRSYLTNRIEPYLGGLKVQELTPVLLDKWIRDLQKSGLAYNTISCVHAFLHNALNYAVYPSQLINSNPASFIKVPKNAPRNVIKRQIISPERFSSLLEKYPFGTELYMPLLLLYHTGMRLGEVLGLTWNDIDFAAKKINLSRQLVYLRKRGYYLTTLKTESSKRYILIDDFLLGELSRWKNLLAANEVTLGENYIFIYKESDGHICRRPKRMPAVGEKISLICVKADGRLALREQLVKLLQKEGLNAHSFRHTHATQLIEQGGVAKAVAYRLGHSNTLITQNLYTHNTLKLQENLAELWAQNLQTNR